MADRIQADHPEQIQRVPPPPSAWGAGGTLMPFPLVPEPAASRPGMDVWASPPRNDKERPSCVQTFKTEGRPPTVAPVSRHPARIALLGVLAIVRSQHFLTSREVCFFPSILRFRFGRRPLAAERRLPSSVLGPVDRPPCSRHRPLPYRSFRLQGVPALVLAPHVCPGKVRGGGSGASLSSCAAHRIPAHRSSMLLASVLL